MIITVNGIERDVLDAATVADIVTELRPDASTRRGVAVAVDRRVVPRTQWDTTTLQAGARVELVAAVQGG